MVSEKCFASIFIDEEVKLTCPHCRGKLVRDGKERYTKSSSVQMQEMTFSRSAEGLIAISRLLIFGVDLSRRLKMFAIALAASLLEVMQM